MVIVPLVGCNYNVVLALMFVNCVCVGFSGGGDALLCLDIAHKYAGTLQGVLGSVSALAGVLAPLLVGLATEKNVSFRLRCNHRSRTSQVILLA